MQPSASWDTCGPLPSRRTYFSLLPSSTGHGLPGPAEHPTGLQTREMLTDRAGTGVLDLAPQPLPGAARQDRVDLACRPPVDLGQLLGAVDGGAKQERPIGAGVHGVHRV